MSGILRVPRSRGALSGLLLVLLGAWGALIPFIGPYFHYAYTPDRAWAYTSGRLWLEILPGAAALLGGLIAFAAATRPAAVFGAWLAALGGAWFVVGRTLSTLWMRHGAVAAGHPVGGTVSRAMEDIGFFTGLGAVIIFFAALALGRFMVIGVREAALAEEEAAATEPAATGPAMTRHDVTEPATVTGPATETEPAATRASGWRRTSRHAAPAGSATSTDSASTAPASTEPVGSEPASTGSATTGSATTGSATAAEPVTASDQPAGRHSAPPDPGSTA